MLDLDLCPHQNVDEHSTEPGFYGSTTVNEEMTSKSILKCVGLTERSHRPSTTANGDDSEEVACTVAFSFDSFRLIVLRRDAFSTVSDIFAASLFHKGGLFVTAAHAAINGGRMTRIPVVGQRTQLDEDLDELDPLTFRSWASGYSGGRSCLPCCHI
ncbi:hypothetical protein DPX16_4381 [Anabarilius grahami]|uniref:Uncharacterized protein n=1 Tax=Anabarilius grahami TaxID=495550 RepID=A0A3N0Z569_ANAGA|nr:hypothetical protein DPX16_4381 [Anabarilius grahami]